ncbi:MAG: class I SAM-dependent rRNA methyltransferase [Bacteroidetes bacterium]|nr:MAG: class I SAM-dependent rRNA methyltransferase [Bacteroidota bacterium]
MFPLLTLKPDREKSVLNFHPWIFTGAVKHIAPEAQHGDIIAVQTHQKKLLGYGFYDVQSQIVCRMFEVNPHPALPEGDYWLQKLQEAYAIRQRLVASPTTQAYRLMHAEGDFLSGVIIDVYGKVAVMQLLIKGTERIAPLLVEALQKLGFEHIYLKNKEITQRLEGVEQSNGWLTAPYSKPIQILENGLKFEIDVEKGQKTGFFIDQRDNRQLLRQYAEGKKVLNTFSYTGGFSVYALAGKAQEVVSVDISKDAIAMCEKTVASNFGENASHRAIAEDCFEFLKNSQPNEYDIIVLDPPAFAKHKKAVANASRGYISLNELGIRRVKKGGLVFTFSCSGNIDRDLFRKIVFTASAESGRKVRIVHQLTQPIDHPVNIYHPEGEYLKGLVLEVE